MSNSSLVTYTRLSKNKTARRSKIDSIIIHCIVGQWTAKQGCDYFATTDREASANYVVGKDGSIGLSVDESYRAWTSGGTDSKGNPIRVNGISGADFDHRAVTIEVASDTESPYAVTDQAYSALIKLCADICRRNNIKQLLWKGDKKYVGTSEQNMGAHRWFANKSCPGDYLYNRMGDIANKVNALIGNDVKSPESEILYRVQVGAYKYKANADSQLVKVKAAGFDTYMVQVDGLYKIQVGAYKQKANADSMLAKVKAKGFSAFVTTESGTPVSSSSSSLAVGNKVKVKSGAKTYTGGNLSSFVYSTVYDVIQIDGDRVVIGLGKAVTAAVNKKDLTLA